MTLELKIGPDAIYSYKRLAYTPWHAFAEFIDNSTQAYFDQQAPVWKSIAGKLHLTNDHFNRTTQPRHNTSK